MTLFLLTCCAAALIALDVMSVPSHEPSAEEVARRYRDSHGKP